MMNVQDGELVKLFNLESIDITRQIKCRSPGDPGLEALGHQLTALTGLKTLRMNHDESWSLPSLRQVPRFVYTNICHV